MVQIREGAQVSNDHHEEAVDQVARNPLMQTMMESLRSERSATTPDTADIPIPGYHDLFVARYKVVPGRIVADLGRRAQRQFSEEHERNIWATVDLIIAANTGLYYRNFEIEDPEKQLVPLDPNHEVGDPAAVAVTYSDPDCATLLGVDTETARDLVYKVFKENDTAIMAHGMMLSRWMADTSKGVDADFLMR